MKRSTFFKGELLQYRKTCKFLGVTFDQKLTFTEHVNDIVNRAKKRLNLLKALRGQTWGASPETLLYSYRTFVRPLMDYSCILFSHSSNTLLKKLQAVETSAIKLVYRLAPWATNSYCYSLVTFTPILDRLKMQSKKFIENYKNDELIKPLLEDIKPSMTGHHSVLFKALNFWKEHGPNYVYYLSLSLTILFLTHCILPLIFISHTTDP